MDLLFTAGTERYKNKYNIMNKNIISIFEKFRIYYRILIIESILFSKTI